MEWIKVGLVATNPWEIIAPTMDWDPDQKMDFPDLFAKMTTDISIKGASIQDFRTGNNFHLALSIHLTIILVLIILILEA